jgi:hypothetical protein
MKRRSALAIFVVVSVSLWAVFALNAAPQAFFSSDLTIHQTQSSSGGRGGERSVTSTMYLSGNAMKHSSSDGNDSIIRLDENKMILIDNNKKTYSEVTFQQLQEFMDKATAAMGGANDQQMEAMRKLMGGRGGADQPISVTKVGPGETIAGYATEKYLVKGPMEMEVHAAPDLKIPAQYYDALKLRMPKNPFFDMGKLMEEMKKMNGVPMKQITTIKMMGMETKSTTLVTSVDKGAIPKTTFDVPAGYKKVDFLK